MSHVINGASSLVPATSNSSLQPAIEVRPTPSCSTQPIQSTSMQPASSLQLGVPGMQISGNHTVLIKYHSQRFKITHNIDLVHSLFYSSVSHCIECVMQCMTLIIKYIARISMYGINTLVSGVTSIMYHTFWSINRKALQKQSTRKILTL